MPRKCQICHVVDHDEQRLVINFYDHDFCHCCSIALHNFHTDLKTTSYSTTLELLVCRLARMRSVQRVLQFGTMFVGIAQHCNSALVNLSQYPVIWYAQWLGLCRSLDTNLFWLEVYPLLNFWFPCNHAHISLIIVSCFGSSITTPHLNTIQQNNEQL